ncbi:Uncharacterised protein [uncultured archaeon]|nr:Uncharacterised protein [uncultured archaeon]
MLELPHPPDHLRAAIPDVGEGQNHVVVGLGHGWSMAGEPVCSPSASLYNGLKRFRLFRLHPGEKGGAQIVADFFIVIDNIDDLSIRTEYARRGIGGVALRSHPNIPVVVRIGRILKLNLLQPRVFPWRLIKMAVDADVAGQLYTSSYITKP